MSIVISILQIIAAIVLFLIGIGLNRGYRASRVELNLMGSEGFARGYKTRQTVLLVVSIILVILALLLFYNALSRVIF
jgi:uncharacterized membrane protein